MEGVDYFDASPHISKLITVRVLLALTTINHWHLEPLDVNNSFLHIKLDEEIYMDLPPGHHATNFNLPHVCKLKKSVYGLKEASRQWYSKVPYLIWDTNNHK